MIHKKASAIILVVTLSFLGGCYKGSLSELKKNHPISYYDDSKEIDNIRINCKRITYDRKHDCTLVKLTIDNQTDASCIFCPTDINVPLVCQKTRERIYEKHNTIKSSMYKAVGYGLLGLIISERLTAPVRALAYTTSGTAFFDNPILHGIIVGSGLLGGLLGGIIGNKKKPTYNSDIKNYYSQESNTKIIFCNETDSIMLLIKGSDIRNFDIALHTSAGINSYNMRLSR